MSSSLCGIPFQIQTAVVSHTTEFKTPPKIYDYVDTSLTMILSQKWSWMGANFSIIYIFSYMKKKSNL